MSIESARAFVARLRADAAFHAQAAALTSEPQVLAFAAAHGFTLTMGDLDAAAGELTPEQLEAVVAGRPDDAAGFLARLLAGAGGPI